MNDPFCFPYILPLENSYIGKLLEMINNLKKKY